LKEAKEIKQKEIAVLGEKCNNLKTILSELKAQLYARFGNYISLEAEEE
jgi:prefoldin subunit 4